MSEDHFAVILTMHKPLWEKMVNKIKTMDIRSTKPKYNTPFKVFVYITGSVGVVGEFVCNNVMDIKTFGEYAEAEKRSNVGVKYIWEYSKGGQRKIYGWDVSQVKIYDKPMNIGSFGLKRPPQSWCYAKENCVCM